MRTQRLIACLSALPIALAASAALAQSPTRSTLASVSYFPLSVGNRWVYERTNAGGRSTWKVEVTGRVSPGRNRSYFSLSGYFMGPPRLVRSDLASAVTEYHPSGRTDNLWYLLTAPVGTTWQLKLEPSPMANPMPDCISGSKLRLAARGEVVRVPAGEFRDVVRVDFQSPCADAGIASEWFAPGVGLVRRTEVTIAGEVASELIQAELEQVTLPRLPYATSLSLDSPLYVNNLMPGPPPGPPPPTVRGAFAVRNLTGSPVELTFSGCASVLVEVRNEAGDTVLHARGDDGGCCTCDNLVQVTLVNGSLVIPLAFPLATPQGELLPAGRYGVTATLESLDAPALHPAAQALIDVKAAY